MAAPETVNLPSYDTVGSNPTSTTIYGVYSKDWGHVGGWDVGWPAALSETATLVFPAERSEGATPDPGDEMILECGIAAEAQLKVTGDKRHLLPLRRFREIDIITPAEFLRRMPAG